MNTIEAKIILIGPPNVGKTSLSCQYVRGRFPENAPSTIGASFLKKNVIIDNTTVVMKIWDTAGQEAYRSSGSLYYNNAEGVIVVFDATDLSTLNELDKCIDELKMQNPEHNYDIHFACNKIDIRDPQGEDRKTIEMRCKGYEPSAKVYYTSALRNTHVGDLFYDLAVSICKRKQNSGPNAAITIGNANGSQGSQVAEEPKKSCCC